MHYAHNTHEYVVYACNCLGRICNQINWTHVSWFKLVWRKLFPNNIRGSLPMITSNCIRRGQFCILIYILIYYNITVMSLVEAYIQFGSLVVLLWNYILIACIQWERAHTLLRRHNVHVHTFWMFHVLLPLLPQLFHWVISYGLSSWLVSLYA